MGSLMKKQAERFLREKKRHRRWLAVFLCLSLLVTSGTFAALRMNGHAMDYTDKSLNCQFQIHEHTEECYDDHGELTCGKADCVIHTHDEQCKNENGEVVCQLPEKEAHVHDDSCYAEERILTCQQEETTGHQHSETCYIEEKSDPICGLLEHGHSEECSDDYGNLICGQEEHWHGEGCYAKNQALICAEQEGSGHTHDESCYKTEKTLTCEKEELEPHTHDENTCYTENLICGQEESVNHTHDDSCYEKTLTCGKPGLKEHQHGPECFSDKKEEGPEEENGNQPEDEPEGTISDGETSADQTSETEASKEEKPQGGENDSEGLETDGGLNGVVSGNTISGDEVSDNAVSGNTASENIISANTVSKNTVRKKAASKSSGKMISWGKLTYEDVKAEENEGVTTWDVSTTDHRILELPVRMNISTASGTKITFPYKLDLKGAGRTVKEVGYTYSPEFKDQGIVEEDWDRAIDEKNNTVTITSKGPHASLDVFYEFDCWNIVSDTVFSIDVEIEVPGQEKQTHTLKGKIHTGHNVTIGAYLNGENSDYGFDGFGGADKTTAYIPAWNQVYQKYFGLTKEEFDNDSAYVYDIAAFLISPTGQQPYDIDGCFKPQGVGAELIGGVYMMKSREDPDALCIKLGKNDFTGSADVGYVFSIKNDSLIYNSRYAAVSNLSDTTNNKVYTLYFLVKYPKIANDEQERTLTANLTLKHTGVENHDPKIAEGESILYKGPQKYRDRIYWAAYNPETGNNQTGLSSLLDNKTATIDYSADFYCLNENRRNFEYGKEPEDLKTYRMEAVIDLSFLLNGGNNTPMLGEGDYQFSAYKLSLIDAPGAWSHNNHGIPNIGWAADKYRNQNGVPRWARDAVIKIYGSKSLTNQNNDTWEEVGSITAAEVWAYNQDRAFDINYQEIGDGYVRLKVVYNSRLTTALRVGYQMQVKPKALDKVPNRGANLEKLKLRSLFNYLAYDGEKADAKDFGRYPVADEEKEWVSTGPEADDGYWKDLILEQARQHDAEYFYPDYETPRQTTDEGYWLEKYSLRNRATITLGKSEDAAGMLVTQSLYDSNGRVLGDKIMGTYNEPHSQHPVDSFAQQKEVTNVSEIVYSITGFATNGSNDQNAFDVYRKAPSTDRAYKAMKQRYYVLLPEGLTLNMAPDQDHFQGEGTEEYLSPIAPFYREYTDKEVSGAQVDWPISKGNIPKWSLTRVDGNTFLNQMLWELSGNYGSVKRNPESGGQLYIFDRTLTEDSVNSYNWWGGGTRCWGAGFSFSVVPKRGTGTLPEEDYTPKFWCQFLDEEDNPIPMTSFLREEDNNVQELSGVSGSGFEKDTLLYIPIQFHNRTAAGSSKSKIELGGGVVKTEDNRNKVELAGNYEYTLEYKITNGNSKNVVLWCNIEEYNRGGEKSEWYGIPLGVDLKGNDNVKVYVQKVGFNVDEYHLSGAQEEWLTDGKHGWEEINPVTYKDWAEVKSIAFSFGETKFDSLSKPSATVAIKMKAPEEGSDKIQKQPYHNRYTTYNEFVFSDKHGVDLQPGQGLSEYTQLDIYIPTEMYELPSTGGAGIYWYMISGMFLMMGASLILYRSRRKNAVRGVVRK